MNFNKQFCKYSVCKLLWNIYSFYLLTGNMQNKKDKQFIGCADLFIWTLPRLTVNLHSENVNFLFVHFRTGRSSLLYQLVKGLASSCFNIYLEE